MRIQNLAPALTMAEVARWCGAGFGLSAKFAWVARMRPWRTGVRYAAPAGGDAGVPGYRGCAGRCSASVMIPLVIAVGKIKPAADGACALDPIALRCSRRNNAGVPSLH